MESEEEKAEKKGPRLKFSFKVYVERDLFSHFDGNDGELTKKIRQDSGVRDIKWDNSITIPENDGKVLSIDDDDIELKKEALQRIADEILKESKKYDAVGVFIPEALVSFLIGQRGRQIDQFSTKSSTAIVVYHPIKGMKYRFVKIKGKASNISKAAGLIYSHIEDKSENIEDIDRPPKYLDVNRAEVTAKLIFPQNVLGHLYGKDKANMNKLVDQHDVRVKFDKDHGLSIISRDEAVCVRTLEFLAHC
jgi:hypothetical protein